MFQERKGTLTPGLLFEDHDWKQIKDPFKILIITSVSELATSEPLFRESIGLCPWQVVLDLDYRSQSPSGLFDFINETLRKHTVMQVESYKSAGTIKEQDKEAVVKGERVLWIQANGSDTLDCDPCLDFFSRSVSKIEPLFSDIFTRFPVKRAILCVIMLLTDITKELNAVNKFGRMIDSLYECKNEKIDILSSKFCVFADQENVKTLSKSEIPENSEHFKWKRDSNSLTFFSQLFLERYGKKSNNIYNIPGSGESFSLSEEDHTQLKPVMELYHRDIGKMNSDNMSEEEYGIKVIEIKYRYLKGNAITPEALYLHEKNGAQMYVDRKDMQNIKVKVREELQLRQKFSLANTSRKGTYVIEHDTSGGGTTCGRYLLFGLRTEYPCIEIKQIGQQLLDWLTMIYRKAQIPLLLLIDNLDCQTSDIRALERYLENKRVKALVVHLKRKVKAVQPSGVLDSKDRTIDMRFDLNSHVIDTADKFAFKKLYETNEKKKFYTKGFYAWIV